MKFSKVTWKLCSTIIFSSVICKNPFHSYTTISSSSCFYCIRSTAANNILVGFIRTKFKILIESIQELLSKFSHIIKWNLETYFVMEYIWIKALPNELWRLKFNATTCHDKVLWKCQLACLNLISKICKKN